MSKRVWLNGAVGVRGIAIIEAIKGLLVLLVGFGLLSLAHRDVEQFAAELVRHAHLNPASHYPHIFIEAATMATDSRLCVRVHRCRGRVITLAYKRKASTIVP